MLQASASGSRGSERNERTELLVGGFPELGVLFCCAPCHTDSNILGSMLGLPCSWNLPCDTNLGTG